MKQDNIICTLFWANLSLFAKIDKARIKSFFDHGSAVKTLGEIQSARFTSGESSNAKNEYLIFAVEINGAYLQMSR